jgi:hypothetical protein
VSTESSLQIEIFRAGSYPQGEFTEADLDQIAAAYDPAIHEAPVTLDHARSGPALGWVASLQRVGDRLLATLRSVSSSLRELVSSGAYRKRSAEIYLDFAGTGKKYLRAVTFLGAGVPEVKGLAEVSSFDEQGGEYFSVTCDLKPGLAAAIKQRLASLLGLLETQAEAEPALFAEEIERARQEGRSEAERELAGARQEVERKARAQEVAFFVEQLTDEGRLLPCWSQGLAAFIEHLEDLEGLEGAEAVAAFGEGGQGAAAWFRGWLEGLPRLVEFAEVAGETESSFVGSAARLEALTLERMRLRPELTFGEAFREVCSAHPGLAADYLDEVS